MILLIIGVFHPPIRPESYGGSLAVTLSIISALTDEGYDVVLFVRNKIDQRKLSQFMGKKLPEKVKIIKKFSILQSRNIINLYENAIKLLALKMKCDLVIDTYSCYIFPWTDISYIHFPYVNNFLFKQRFPYLPKRNGILSDAINLPYIFFARNLQDYRRKLIIANSTFTAKAIKEAMNIDAKVLYPPLPESLLEGLRTHGRLRRKNRVVTVGRITSDKKIEVIPKIAGMLRNEDIEFFIVGFLHDRKIFKKICTEIERLNLKDKVRVLTNVSKEELREILGKAKVYLHPPTIEHFGISIAEAMAMGCIPVVYDIGGANEFVPAEYVYKNIYEASLKVAKAIDSWTEKEAKRMNSIVQKFSDSNFRKNFITIFSNYCQNMLGN